MHFHETAVRKITWIIFPFYKSQLPMETCMPLLYVTQNNYSQSAVEKERMIFMELECKIIENQYRLKLKINQ